MEIFALEFWKLYDADQLAFFIVIVNLVFDLLTVQKEVATCNITRANIKLASKRLALH